MIAWVAYTLIISACVLTAAFAADRLARIARLSTRLVWFAAASLIMVLPAIAPLRGRIAARELAAPMTPTSLEVLQTSVASVGRHVPASALWIVLALWALATLAVAASFTMTYLRLRRTRRQWPMLEVHGQSIRVSPDVGPIVVGLVRPEIILPRWVLSRSAEEQRIIIAHECAHVAASDPLLLAIACAAIALVPWNPALWIVLARLRLAVELDCDARVLRGGVSPRIYGSLLVDVAESALPLGFAATALADDSSHLQQRISAMFPRSSNHRLLRGGAAAVLALAALLAACEAKMPTSKDIDALDARSAERGAVSLGLARDSIAGWTVDGVVTTALEARKIAPESIATMNVTKSPIGSRIAIVTKRAAMAAQTSESPAGTKTAGVVAARPIIFIDGVRSDDAALKALDRSRIVSVNILKGPSAKEQYGADALGGVIVVKTTADGR
jgi:beta-lactamase regulating signal transducer with metallopeptidase domain